MQCSTNCLETLYSILEYVIEVYHKVLGSYVDSFGRYSLIRFIRYIFHNSCFYSHNTFHYSHKLIQKHFRHQI